MSPAHVEFTCTLYYVLLISMICVCMCFNSVWKYAYHLSMIAN